jgi:hypothetical protein
MIEIKFVTITFPMIYCLTIANLEMNYPTAAAGYQDLNVDCVFCAFSPLPDPPVFESDL